MENPAPPRTLRERLANAHKLEREYNIEIGKVDIQIKLLKLRKKKLARMISKNMKYRNKLINEL